MLRSHTARSIAVSYGAYATYLSEAFYVDIDDRESTVDSCLRDIQRSRDRYILRYKGFDGVKADFNKLPVWAAVEAWSFGTLSKVLERGARGELCDHVAASVGAAKTGFAYRIRALVYFRNRSAHHGRLWNHSVIDAGPTPNNVRAKAKRLAGQFGPRSVLDVIAPLDDILNRGNVEEPFLPELTTLYKQNSAFLGRFVET